MLQVESVHVAIQSVQVLRGLSLQIDTGHMVGLVGRNGAGKTTLIRTLMGQLSPSQGRIVFDGQDLCKLPSHARAALGIGYMPEDRGLVPELTVEENILVPVWVNKTLNETERLALVYRVLPELQEMRSRRALLLSHSDPMVFVRSPISATMLAMAAIALIIVMLPSLRKKREEAFQEE